jgi:hypothetical protein
VKEILRSRHPEDALCSPTARLGSSFFYFSATEIRFPSALIGKKVPSDFFKWGKTAD